MTLFDDVIEGISTFDPLTGQIFDKVKRFTVYPSSHYVTPRETVLNAMENIKEELQLRIKEFTEQKKLVEAQRIEQRTKFDLEMLNEIGFCKGIENYSRHLSGRKPGEAPPTPTINNVVMNKMELVFVFPIPSIADKIEKYNE